MKTKPLTRSDLGRGHWTASVYVHSPLGLRARILDEILRGEGSNLSTELEPALRALCDSRSMDIDRRMTEIHGRVGKL